MFASRGIPAVLMVVELGSRKWWSIFNMNRTASLLRCEVFHSYSFTQSSEITITSLNIGTTLCKILSGQKLKIFTQS